MLSNNSFAFMILKVLVILTLCCSALSEYSSPSSSINRSLPPIFNDTSCGYVCYLANSSNAFQCNGARCSQFYWPTNKSSPSGIECYYSDRDCYTSQKDNDNYYLYTACNYSISYCQSCTQNTKGILCYKCSTGYGRDGDQKKCSPCTDIDPNCVDCTYSDQCSSCKYGYVKLSNYSSGSTVTTCLKCSDAIPGCIKCDSQQKCLDCQLRYIPINGLCYQKDGKTLAYAVDNQGMLVKQLTAGNSLQQDMNDLLGKIFVALIVMIGVLVLGIGVVCWTSRKSTQALQKRSLLSGHD